MEYVALLRGINVGGHRKLPMQDLKQLCAELGWAAVRTYIQSGNLLFEAPDSPEVLAARLSESIRARFGFEVPTLVLSAADWKQLIAQNPFLAQAEAPALESLHLTLLAQSPDPELLASLPSSGGDSFHSIGRALYLHCPQGYGHTKLTNDFFERRLQQPATTRNWKTVQQLAALL